MLRTSNFLTGAGARVGAQNNAAVVSDADDGGSHRVRSVQIAVNCIHDYTSDWRSTGVSVGEFCARRIGGNFRKRRRRRTTINKKGVSCCWRSRVQQNWDFSFWPLNFVLITEWPLSDVILQNLARFWIDKLLLPPSFNKCVSTVV